ncbi:MAG: OmpA family protein [Formosimonas sp.]
MLGLTVDVASDAVSAVGGVVSSAAGAVVSGAEAVVDGVGNVGEKAYDALVGGAETVIGGVGEVASEIGVAAGEVVGAVAETASETVNNIGEGVAAIGAGTVAAGAAALGMSSKTVNKAAGGVGGFLKRFWWLLPLLLLAGLLLKNCGGKDAAPVAPAKPVEATPAPAPTPAPAAKAALGTWALNMLGGGKFELAGKVADQATKDAMIAAAKKAYGEANVVDKLVVDAAAPAVGFKGDWTKLFELFKGNGAHMSLNGDTVKVEGEVDEATKASLIAALKGALGDGVTIDDKLMLKGATASAGAALLKVEFATGSSSIPAAAQAGLKAFAADLVKSGKKGEIGGHTDNVGDAAKNTALSAARAKAVVEFLVKQGVPADALTSKGYGDTAGIADNATADGRARNRRVEFK